MDNSNNIAIKTKNITISHCFFGRKGGKSQGLYASLNCSGYVGDSDEAVKANLDIAKSFLTSESTAKLITLKQIHSNICVEITKDNAISGIEADAMVTKEKNIAIGILTADCAPVLFFRSTKIHYRSSTRRLARSCWRSY